MQYTSNAFKTNMIAKYNREMVVDNILKNALIKVKEMLSDGKWDGKVANRRLATFIESNLSNEETKYKYYVSFKPEYKSRYIYIQLGNDARCFYGDNNKFLGYIESAQHRFEVAFKYDNVNNERIILSETIANIDATIERINNNIAKLNDMITHFDTYMERNREVEEFIRKYEKEVPIRLRTTYLRQENQW